MKPVPLFFGGTLLAAGCLLKHTAAPTAKATRAHISRTPSSSSHKSDWSSSKTSAQAAHMITKDGMKDLGRPCAMQVLMSSVLFKAVCTKEWSIVCITSVNNRQDTAA
mmetsp:Transcript_65942/g.187324  ORF Transcript_65942/g.187324 Transcript_65942/m.187324 type:complete len:108 (-) Transcript_65942:32-355(-)